MLLVLEGKSGGSTTAARESRDHTAIATTSRGSGRVWNLEKSSCPDGPGSYRGFEALEEIWSALHQKIARPTSSLEVC